MQQELLYQRKGPRRLGLYDTGYGLSPYDGWSMKPSYDCLILGGGIIGLSSAWKLAEEGKTVAIVDPHPGRGAAWVAAGMLAAASEAHFGEQDHVALLRAAAAAWPEFSTTLSAATTQDLDFLERGTLLVGCDGGDKAEFDRSVQFQQSLGHDVAALGREEAFLLEPALSHAVRSVYRSPNDHQVDPRLVLEALSEWLPKIGVHFIREHVTSIEDDGSFGKVTTSSGATYGGSRLILTLGAFTNLVPGTKELAVPQIRPIKGHILRLFGESILHHTIRGLVHGRPIYFVQRSTGELVVGATSEEKGFDQRIQAGEIFRLLDDARTLVPAIDELELREAQCGLRPAPSDNLPVVDWLIPDRVALAVGHYRNGVLLAPLTGLAVRDLLANANSPTLDLFGKAT